MGLPYVVTLDVRIGSAPDSTWTNVNASNGTAYCFKFGGGTDGLGNVTATLGNAVDVAVRLVADNRFTVNTVTIVSDKEKQLEVKETGIWEAEISDKNSKSEDDGYYQLLLNDTIGNCTLLCDPKISNTPPS